MPSYDVNVMDYTDINYNPYSLSRYLELPFCTEMDADGRWVLVTDLPFDPSLVPLPDNYNRVWLPYTCQMRRISYDTLTKTLNDRRRPIHWFGDSNTRRALKKITTLGEWCTLPEDLASRKCICEDQGERFPIYNTAASQTILDVNSTDGGHKVTGRYNPQQVPKDNIRIISLRVGGLTNNSNFLWQNHFASNLTKRFGHPSTIILSLTNWDAAFTSLSYFANQLDMLMERINDTYDGSAKIIVRTGQYFCCHTDTSSSHRRYSRLRNRAFDNYLISAIRLRLGKKYDIHVWDV
ncbi:hypothetical protein COEREDRAFT_80430, partial [Coemansia reversa NRRL 1564]